MRKNIIIFFCLIALLLQCSKNDDNKNQKNASVYNSNGRVELSKEETEEKLAEMRKKIKDEYLPQFSNTRPFENVISERELVNGLVDYFLKFQYNMTYEYYKTFPDWFEKGELGDIILVEDFVTVARSKFPYYYYVYGQFEDSKYSFTRGIAYALTTDNRPGAVGESSDSPKDSIPSIVRTKSEAIKILKQKFSIPDTNTFQIKAVSVKDSEYNSRFSWYWAFKFNEAINLKKYGKNITTFFLCVSHYDYDFNWINTHNWETPNSKERKEELINQLSQQTSIGYLNKDVFDPAVGNTIRVIKKPTPSVLENEVDYMKRFDQYLIEYNNAVPTVITLETYL